MTPIDCQNFELTSRQLHRLERVQRRALLVLSLAAPSTWTPKRD
jgi:hypothetical protein